MSNTAMTTLPREDQYVIEVTANPLVITLDRRELHPDSIRNGADLRISLMLRRVQIKTETSGIGVGKGAPDFSPSLARSIIDHPELSLASMCFNVSSRLGKIKDPMYSILTHRNDILSISIRTFARPGASGTAPSQG